MSSVPRFQLQFHVNTSNSCFKHLTPSGEINIKMAMELLDPPPHLSPETALRMSQQAPRILQTSPTTSLPYPLSLFISGETPETWTAYENLLVACLRTGDDKSARLCLDRLTERFGEKNERIMAMRGMYEEAVASDTRALERVLKQYEDILKDDPTNMVCAAWNAASGIAGC